MPPARLQRGGARNRKDRTSWQLTNKQCQLIIERSFDAWDVGLPLNRFITLAWGLAGIDPCDAVRATGHFITMAREWMRRHRYPMPWVWVQERGATLGQHVHILLHVPAELDLLFRPMPARWAKKIAGQGYRSGTVDSQRLREAYTAETDPELYRARVLGKLHYMLKCAPERLEGPMGMIGWGHKPWGQSSRVVGKRAGGWQRR